MILDAPCLEGGVSAPTNPKRLTIMTLDQNAETRSDGTNLPAIISHCVPKPPSGLLPRRLFPGELKPFSDLVIIFPTETKPVAGHDAALNKAALVLHTKGVICLLPGYLEREADDFIWLEINGVRGPIHTVSQEEIDNDQITVLFMDSGRFIDQANNTVQAFVKRTGGAVESSKVFNFLADREPPVGRDPIPSTPYNDNMSPVTFEDPQIENFGFVTDEQIGLGVSMLIANYPLNTNESPVHSRKENDVIHVSIGGVIIKHTVTSFEASGNEPIRIVAYHGTWSQLPNGVHLVQWYVVDKAGNHSPGFSPSRLIELRAGNGVEPLLPMVHVLESHYDPEIDKDVINVPDLIGDATIEVPIRFNGYNINDVVVLTVYGLVHAISSSIVLRYTVTNTNLIRAYIPLPLSFLLPLVDGLILITYKRIRPGTPDRNSSAALYYIFGNPTGTQLPPPEVQGLINGVLPENTDPVHIVVPHYMGQNSQDRVELVVVGFPASGAPTYATYTDVAGTGDIDFILDGAFFFALYGGYFKAHYIINGGIPRPPSDVAIIYVGKTQNKLPAPTTLQAVPPDFRFNPLIHKGNLNVRVQPHPSIVAGTEIRVIFIGSKPGGSYTSPWFRIDENWEDAEIPFTIGRTVVLNNEGGTAHLYYELKPVMPGPTQFSLELIIAIGGPRILPLPSVVQATYISETRVELNPVHVIAPNPPSLEVRVTSNTFPNDADIKIIITGKPGVGTPDIPARPSIPEPGETYTRFNLSSDFVAAYLGGEFNVSYQLMEASGTTSSPNLTVEVLALPDSLLDLVTIPETVGGAINPSVANHVRINRWPFFRASQLLWIDILSSTDLALRVSMPVTSAEFTAGRTLDLIPASYLRSLPDNSTVTIQARVSLDGSGNESTAQHFSRSPVYRIKKASGVVEGEIQVGHTPSHLALSKDDSRLYVTNVGDRTISVIDTDKGEVIRTLQVTGTGALSGIAVSPNGRNLYVSLLSTSTLVIETTHFQTIATISSAGFPYNSALRLNPTGSRLYSGNEYYGGLQEIDTSTNKYVRWLNGGSYYTQAIAFNHSGTRIYTNGYHIRTFDQASGTIIGSFTVPRGSGRNFGLAYSPTADVIYATNAGSYATDGYLMMLSAATVPVTLIKRIENLGYPWGIAFAPDGTKAYMCLHGENSIKIIDTTTQTITGEINTSSYPLDRPKEIVITSDGSRAYVANSGNANIIVVSL